MVDHSKKRKKRGFTSKQMGDACEMLVAAELTLSGIPSLKVPDNWPGYDVIAQPMNSPPLRISVKARTFSEKSDYFVEYNSYDQFDWLAVVFLECPGRRTFIIPRDLADKQARRNNEASKLPHSRYWSQKQFRELFALYENNVHLSHPPRTAAQQSAGAIPE